MPKDHLFPPGPGSYRAITLTGDDTADATMLGAIVNLDGHDLEMAAFSGSGTTIVTGPGTLSGDIVMTLTASQSVQVTLLDGEWHSPSQPQPDALTRTAAQGSPQGSDTLTLAGPVGLSGGTVALVQTSDKQWEEGGNWLVAYDVDRWMISGPSYGAQKVSVAESPAGLTDWNVTTGSGQPTLEESVTVPATYLGQQCLVGDTPATREIYIALGTGASTVWAKLPKSGEVPHL